MGHGPRWSLIVPSYNGADTLPACLEALVKLREPAGGAEIILVDNASNDGTAGLMRQFAERHSALFLSEPRKGKAYALNRAIERAQGEVLVFLDDDVIAEPGLLEAYASAEAAFPQNGVFAGQLRPGWQTTPARWLEALAEEGRCCGCTPAGRGAGWIAPIDTKGGNMCFRRSAMGAARFATEGVNFGAGTGAVGGLDTEFAGRIAGEDGVRFVPDASGKHIIQPHEMTWSAVYRRHLRIGRGTAAQRVGGTAILSVALRGLARAGLAVIALLLGRRTEAARHGTYLAMRIGALDQLINARDSAPV